MSSFGMILRSLRTKEGMSQDLLSVKLGISRSAIGMYEQGKREPDFETMEKIADFFNVDMNYLLGKSEEDYYLDLQTKQIAMQIIGKQELRVLIEELLHLSNEDLAVLTEVAKQLRKNINQ